jgi:hypothetical protein
MEKGIYHDERKDLKKHKSNGEAMVAQSTNPSKTTPYDYSGEKDFFSREFRSSLRGLGSVTTKK